MNYKTIKERIPNGKGLSIAMEMYLPISDTPVPAVLLFHGFTGYKESPDLVDISAKLATKGICAVRFTATGMGDSDGTLSHDYSFTNFRSDSEIIYNYVTHDEQIDAERIGVFGHSLGGTLTVLFAADHQEIRALCAVSPVAAFRNSYYGIVAAEWKTKGYFEKVSGRDGKILQIPYRFFEDMELPEHDVLQAAQKVTAKRILIIAGDADSEVPLTETEKVFAALPGKTEFRIIPGMVHKYKSQPEIMERVDGSIAAFFEGSL